MTTALFCFDESLDEGQALATQLDILLHPVSVHKFPDGESLVTVAPPPRTAILFRTLDQPNTKIFELLLAASALRDNGAARVYLVAPYLAYMRQDKAFARGQAVSQKVFAELISHHFDGLLTVDPHLHRIASLSAIMPGIEAISISAASVLGEALRDDAVDQVLAGPDSESRQWVESVAKPLGLDILVGSKKRLGDREVRVEFDDVELVAGRRVVLVDDVISSGQTLIAAAQGLKRAGAGRIEVLASHCLARSADLEALQAAGIERIRATRTVSGPASTLPVGPLLADAIRSCGWLEGKTGQD